MCEDFTPKNRSKRARRMQTKKKTKYRSVYAKALEDNRYRKRVIESKRKEDIDDWIEDDLNEYYTEKILKTENSQTD